MIYNHSNKFTITRSVVVCVSNRLPNRRKLSILVVFFFVCYLEPENLWTEKYCFVWQIMLPACSLKFRNKLTKGSTDTGESRCFVDLLRLIMWMVWQKNRRPIQVLNADLFWTALFYRTASGKVQGNAKHTSDFLSKRWSTEISWIK